MTTAALATAARNGDLDAFTELVERYQTMAFGYALATLGDYQLAEDAVQIALLTAYGHLGSLRDPARFGGWLRGIVRFECLRLIRERQRATTQPLEQTSIPLGSLANEVEEEAISATILKHILQLLGQLPERQRVVATLYYLQDQSQAEVADFLGLPISTINNRLREARRFLRTHGAHLMNESSPTTPDLSQTIGEVLRGEGPSIEARLQGDIRPDLLTAVRVTTGDRSIGAFIAQYLDDDTARLIVQPDLTDTIQPGATIRSSGMPVTTPIDTGAIDHVIASAIRNQRPQSIETGIKVIDLFAPLRENGTVAIVGDRNVGKMVLVDELVRRLGPTGQRLTMLVFLRTPDETGVMHLLEYRSAGTISVVGIPVADASPAALGSTLDRVDTVLVMSRELGRQQFYPAIDPITSRATFRADDEVVAAARRLLTDEDSTNPRVATLRAYLTQPFFVAEPYTHRPGVTVAPGIAWEDLATIVHGVPDAFSDIDLFMQGSLPRSRP